MRKCNAVHLRKGKAAQKEVRPLLHMQYELEVLAGVGVGRGEQVAPGDSQRAGKALECAVRWASPVVASTAAQFNRKFSSRATKGLTRLLPSHS